MSTLFEFDTVEEFDKLTSEKVTICNCLLSAVQTGLNENNIQPVLFEITVKDSDYTYEIYLDRSEWPSGLQTCLEVYTASNKFDEAIDAYNLLKEVKAVVEP
jgi:hypothetical protein